jgi:hypothetical protein
MTYSLKYIEDSKGRIKAVQMSAAEWRKIKAKLEQADLLTKLDSSLRSSLKEVRLHESGRKSLAGWREALEKL